MAPTGRDAERGVYLRDIRPCTETTGHTVTGRELQAYTGEHDAGKKLGGILHMEECSAMFGHV